LPATGKPGLGLVKRDLVEQFHKADRIAGRTAAEALP
jgi:hypothetical protein